jgi:hypothetical protein
MNVSYLKQHGFVAQNAAAAAANLDAAAVLSGAGAGAGGLKSAEVVAARAKRAKLLKKAAKGDEGAAAKLAESAPVMGRWAFLVRRSASVGGGWECGAFL